MGYDLRIAEPGDGWREATLHLSVWQMSLIRDRMLECGAAYDVNPTRKAHDSPCTDRRGTGIPAYKVSMIDGWLVTPEEAGQALDIIGRSGAEEVDDADWKRWLDFLRDARRLGGFWVE
jgi:hypothetical protein